MTQPRLFEVAVIEGTKKHRSQVSAVATEFYGSTLFRLALSLARQRHHDLVIVSAKYGLVEQLEELDPYELSLRDLTRAQLRAWAFEVAEYLSGLYLNEHLLLVTYASPRGTWALQQAMRRVRPAWRVLDPLEGLSWHGRETWFRQQGAVA